MSFDPNHIKLAKLTYQLQKWQMVKVYAVSRILSVQTAEKKNEFQFDFDYHLEHKGFHQMNHLIDVSRHNFKINGQAPDMLISKLTEQLQSGIYPIRMKIDPFGRWVGNDNFEEIKSRFQQKKEELQKVHEGPGFINLVESFHNSLENEQIFLDKMRKDSSLLYLFLPVYRHYGILDKIEKDEILYPYKNDSQISFSGDLNYRKEGNFHISSYQGKLNLTPEELAILKRNFGLNEDSILKGSFLYERKTETYPFSLQNIQIEIYGNSDLILKEELNFRFLRLLH
jgi:hypothetical protein